jgi:hypothetical protein
MGASITYMKTNPCKAAATRAYRELRQRGVPDRPAFEAAVMVYRCHHPETASSEAKWIVCDWITEELGE